MVRSALAGHQRAAGDLAADALGNAEPGVNLRVLLGRAGAGRSRSLAVVLAGLGNAEALLGCVLGLDLAREQQCGAESGSDGESGFHDRSPQFRWVSLSGVRTMPPARLRLKYRVPMGSMRAGYGFISTPEDARRTELSVVSQSHCPQVSRSCHVDMAH